LIARKEFDWEVLDPTRRIVREIYGSGETSPTFGRCHFNRAKRQRNQKQQN
jgi:hypothetical protein